MRKKQSDHTCPEPTALRAEFWNLPDEALVSRKMIAAASFKSVATLESMAIKGGGPKYRRIGRNALSTKGEVIQWWRDIGRTVENAAQLHDHAASASAK